MIDSQFIKIIDNLPLSIIITNILGDIVFVNKTFEKITQYSFHEVIGKNPRLLKSEESTVNYFELWRTITQGHEWFGEFTNKKKDGTIFYEIAIISPIIDHGEIQYFLAIKEDVSKIKELETIKNEYLTIFDAMLCSITEFSPILDEDQHIIDFKYIKVNSYLEKEFNRKKEDIIGQSLLTLFPLLEKEIILKFIEVITHNTKLHFEYYINELKKTYEIRLFKLNSNFLDVSNKIIYQENLKYIASHDFLTGLVNRHGLNKFIQHHSSKSFTIVFIDIDKFKLINDSLGHEEGDRVLQEISSILINKISPDDLVCRFGGDEFVILLGEHDFTKISSHIEDIYQTIKKKLHFSDKHSSFFLSCSIGVAYHIHNATINSLIDVADSAMYEAKKCKHEPHIVYVNSADDYYKKLNIKTYLYHNINNHFSEFYLMYQPQFNINDLSIFGVEVLMRWKNKILGEVFPNQFIPLLEHEGFIKEASLFVFNQSFQELNTWFDLKTSINISSLYIPDEIPIWSNLIDSVIFEITESIEISSFDLQTMKDHRFTISLDDFGTGFNSLINLSDFPIDYLKLDMFFIRKIGQDVRSEMIIKNVIQLCHDCNIQVIAEGVETLEQLHFLKTNHCDIIQGFLLGRPMSIDQLKIFMQQYKTP